jgi:DHA2 family multidrug resistance protein
MAMGTLTNQQMGNASGVFNLMRNIGGSIGIAAVTTMLARGSQVHQATMVSHLTPYDPIMQERLRQIGGALSSQTGTPATQQAYGVIYGTVVRQATVMSYIDNFRLLAFLCMLCIPAVFLFKRVKRAGPAPPMH